MLLKDRMWLWMKNFLIIGFHWKVRFLGEGYTKNQYIGGSCLKKGVGQFADLRGAWQKEGDSVFEGVLIPQFTLCESTLYSYLNVKELLAWNRQDIWSLGDWNQTRTLNHLVCKRTLIWLNGWVFIYKLSGYGFESHCKLCFK